MVREAGGYITDLDGKDTTPATVDVLAGNETIHRELLKVLKAAGKELETLPSGRASEEPAFTATAPHGSMARAYGAAPE